MTNSSNLRVASLLPSATEMVCAVGAQDTLVGRSHECDYPSGLESLEVLTSPRAVLPTQSGDIHRALEHIVQDATSVYLVDVEGLRRANPDVIVTQDLCDVCAVSIGDVHRALAELASHDVEIISLKPLRLQDVWDDLRRVGAGLGRDAAGERAAAGLEARCAALGERAREATSADAATPRPSVLTIEWLDPVMIGGTWMPEMVDLAGGQALVTEPGQHAPTLDLQQLRALDPDVVLIKPCGFSLAHSERELQTLRSTLPWDTWRAVRNGRVFLADGNAYFNRPGPRLVESLEILAACVHPEVFRDLRTKHAAAFRQIDHSLVLRDVHTGAIRGA